MRKKESASQKENQESDVPQRPCIPANAQNSAQVNNHYLNEIKRLFQEGGND